MLRQVKMAVSLLIISGGAVSAQVIDCATIVNNNVFNKRSTQLSEKLIENMQADICSQNFESARQASTYMRNGGWKLDVFGYFDNSLLDRKQQGSNSYSVKNSKFCNLSSSEFSKTLGSSFEEVNGKFAFDAFRECVRITSSDVMALSYETIGDGAGQLITGELVRYVSGRPTALAYDIQGFGVTPRNAKVQCSVISQDIPENLSVNRPISVNVTHAPFACERVEDRTVVIDIQTSQGGFRVISPSSSENETTSLEELTREVGELSINLAELVQSTDNNNEKLIREINDAKARLEKVNASLTQSVAEARQSADSSLKYGSQIRLYGDDNQYLFSYHEKNSDEHDVLLSTNADKNTLWQIRQ